MTWIGTRVLDTKTDEIGKIIDMDNDRYCHLVVLFPNGSEQIITMNNIITSRKSEIWTQEQYKHLFYENKDLDSLPYEWLPFADEHFVENPIDLIEKWAKLSPKLKESHIYTERKKNKEIAN